MEDVPYLVASVGPHEQEGDKELERLEPVPSERLLVHRCQLTAVLTVKHGLNPIRLEMYHHIPPSVLFVDAVCLFVHRYFLPLSVQIVVWRNKPF